MSEAKTPEQRPSGAQPAPAARPQQARVNYAGDLASRAIYADGIHGVSLRGGVARIDLYQAIIPGDENQTEQRVVSHRLVLPLPALGELATMLNSMREAMQKATEQRREQGKTSP